ncbi:MAG TPA: hypothetical protein VG963_01215, partial [Polyangiaceae bacterium]|nr:hypothetical protein [Polyangiaceae bacterium]
MGKARARVLVGKAAKPPRAVVLDSGALIAFERGDARMREPQGGNSIDSGDPLLILQLTVALQL